MTFFKHLRRAHRFFVTNPPMYIGKRIEGDYPGPKYRYKVSLKNKLYYPIAYMKFMYYSIEGHCRMERMKRMRKKMKEFTTCTCSVKNIAHMPYCKQINY